MEPAYKPGDVIWVHPKVHGQPGNDVLLMPANESVDKRRCLRELISETDTEWVVRQHSPGEQTKMLKSEWPQCLKIQSKDNA
jgi:phage repressor protein C with HTH and peptisase S24 domain